MQKRLVSMSMALILGLSLVLFLGRPVIAADSVAVLDAYIAGWNRHDPAQCASYFDQDIDFYDAYGFYKQLGLME